MYSSALCSKTIYDKLRFGYTSVDSKYYILQNQSNNLQLSDFSVQHDLWYNYKNKYIKVCLEWIRWMYSPISILYIISPFKLIIKNNFFKRSNGKYICK